MCIFARVCAHGIFFFVGGNLFGCQNGQNGIFDQDEDASIWFMKESL